MKISLFVAALMLTALSFIAAPAQTNADREGVRQAVLDYVEGIYNTEPARIERSVHPKLAKFGFYRPPADEAYRAGNAMTHAWFFTGPPGSGRSVAARAFAAALQCEHGPGCGTCAGCHTTLAGTHADVRFVVPEGLSIGVGEMRALVLRAASAPAGGRWQVLLIEDADRLTEAAGNALLKAIEEPAPRTVFLLCTPSTHPDDISVTIRSRCRLVRKVR